MAKRNSKISDFNEDNPLGLSLDEFEELNSIIFNLGVIGNNPPHIKTMIRYLNSEIKNNLYLDIKE